MFSVCVLCFGDYPQLARRCLNGISPYLMEEPPQLWRHLVADVRIGLHEVSELSRELIRSWSSRISRYVPVLWYEPEGNLLKYPTMRRMFFDTQHALSKFIAWLDDDTYFVQPAEQVLAGAAELLEGGAYLVGQYRWFSPLSETYERFIKAQAWYKGPIRNVGRKFQFCIGGWWAGRRELALVHGYPQPELRHKGGDWILSLLCQSNDLPIVNYCEGVMVNADDSGRPNIHWRRGLSAGHVEKNLGVDYGQRRYTDEHQDFETAVRVWRDSCIVEEYVLQRV